MSVHIPDLKWDRDGGLHMMKSRFSPPTYIPINPSLCKTIQNLFMDKGSSNMSLISLIKNIVIMLSAHASMHIV